MKTINFNILNVLLSYPLFIGMKTFDALNVRGKYRWFNLQAYVNNQCTCILQSVV